MACMHMHARNSDLESKGEIIRFHFMFRFVNLKIDGLLFCSDRLAHRSRPSIATILTLFRFQLYRRSHIPTAAGLHRHRNPRLLLRCRTEPADFNFRSGVNFFRPHLLSLRIPTLHSFSEVEDFRQQKLKPSSSQF